MEIDSNKIAKEVLRLRLSQMIVNEEYKAGRFKIPIHLALGHEAIAVAVSAVMEEGDQLLPTHRNLAYNLAREGKLRPILDEYLLKSSGLNEGHSGSMNLLNPQKGIPYASSILGNQFGVATGLAMATKISGKNNSVIVLGGDGSMEEGSFYESMLMARSMDLPVIFLIENNEWSMSTSIKQRRSPIDLSLLSESLDIRYINLIGNDPLYYIDTLKDIRSFGLTSSLPVCVEVGVSTLGDWKMKTQDFPDGEFINYHAGPAPEVSLNAWPIIKESEEDPVFVLTKNFDLAVLKKMAEEELSTLHQEIS
jgi:pyruvate dehydrogenase E1 component alpha subunit